MTDRPTRSIGKILLLVGAGIMAGIGLLLTNIQQRKDEAKAFPARVVTISQNELDPAVWGQNFPNEYDLFLKTKDDTISTPYGGSVPYSKLERDPNLIRFWAGYPFSVEYNEERGHQYALIDQEKTKRQQVAK